MQNQSPDRSPNRSPEHRAYDVQSTYMPGEDPQSSSRADNSNPFGLYDLEDDNRSAFPEADNPFVGSVAGAPAPMHSGGTASVRVAPAAAQGDAALVFHGEPSTQASACFTLLS